MTQDGPHRYFRQLDLVFNYMPSELIIQQKNGPWSVILGTRYLQRYVRLAAKSTPAETVN